MPPSSPDGLWTSGPASFPTTRWSRIFAARDGDLAAAEAQGALEDLELDRVSETDVLPLGTDA